MMMKETTQHIVRPPIVVVMGHVDHGKTSVLDYYRNTKVVETESGGITQHVGAYEVEYEGKKITFIDTPGHEAFSAIRSRGGAVADIAILVIAAEEGIKPQTKEAIEIIQKNKLPFIVVFNKIDKEGANPERVKQELAQENILVESYGGKVPSVEVSAKTGKNMNELLETILLLADIEHFTFSPEKRAEGTIIEAHRDKRRGITATLLLRDGLLAKSDTLVIGRSVESLKILENFRGDAIDSAAASSPVRVAGLSQLPNVGDGFYAFPTRKDAEEYIKTHEETEENIALMSSGKVNEETPFFSAILKGDVVGSVEALEESLKKMESEKICINILRRDTGAINESDVKMALATKQVTIIGFKVGVDASAAELAKRGNIYIVTGDVIYELLDQVRERIAHVLPPVVERVHLGTVKILKIFNKEGQKQIVGGRVTDGAITRGALVEIKRNQKTVGKGKIVQLRRMKDVVEEVSGGSECGVAVDADTKIFEGDILDIFLEEVTKQTVSWRCGVGKN